MKESEEARRPGYGLQGARGQRHADALGCWDQQQTFARPCPRCAGNHFERVTAAAVRRAVREGVTHAYVRLDEIEKESCAGSGTRGKAPNNMFRREPELSNELLQALEEYRSIGIHSASGSGKSSLARDLAERLGGTYIGVDELLAPPEGQSYLERLGRVRPAILEMTKFPIIIESYLLLDVLEKMGFGVDVTVLCRRGAGSVHFRFNTSLEEEWAEYQNRRRPEQIALMEFKLDYPGLG